MKIIMKLLIRLTVFMTCSVGEADGISPNVDMYYWKFQYTWNDGDFGKGTNRDGDAFICK